MIRSLAIVLAAALLTVAAVSTPAQAADMAAEPVKAHKNPFARCSFFNNVFIYGDPTDCPGDETVPLCTQERVVASALRFFARAEKVYRTVGVTRLSHVREVPDTRRNPSPLVRRYCTATATLDNGHHARAHFFIEEDAGFVGLAWAVEACLDGYDKWRVYDGKCRVARPVTRY